MKKRMTPLVSTALCAGLLFSGIVGANAAPIDSKEGSTLVALKAASAEALSAHSALGRSVSESSVDIPASSSEKISLTTSTGNSLSLGLPFATEDAPAEPIGEGLVSFDNGNGSLTVPVPQQDNSVAIHTVIEHRAAPSEYAYAVDVPLGGSLILQENGGVMIVDDSGDFVGGFTPPWAKDATGAALPTSYEVRGTQLVQLVNHSGANVTYPVVADPWLGGDLMMYPWISYPNTVGRYIVNVNPTQHGRFYSGFATHSAHVSELRNKLSRIGYGLASTIQEQFLCHVAGNAFEPGTYNLESWRPTVYWGNQLNLWDRCNP